MVRTLDYRWRLRKVMANRGMFATTDLIEPLAQRGIHLSSSQIYRLVAERAERLSLKVLMALLDMLDCSMDELIEPIPAATSSPQGQGGGWSRERSRRIAPETGPDRRSRWVSDACSDGW